MDREFTNTDTCRPEVYSNSVAVNKIDTGIMSLQEPIRTIQANTAIVPSQLEQGFQHQNEAMRKLSADVHQLVLTNTALQRSIIVLPPSIEAGTERTLDRSLRVNEQASGELSGIRGSSDAMGAQLATLTQVMKSHGFVPGRSLLEIPPSARAETFSAAQNLQNIMPFSSLTPHQSIPRRNSSHLREKSWARQFRLRIWWLSRFFVMSFYSNRGAGGLSISASLQLSGVIFEESPVFRKLRSLNSDRWTGVTVKKLEDSAKQIAILYENQQASPGDIDPSGMNALHVGNALDVICDYSTNTSKAGVLRTSFEVL